MLWFNYYSLPEINMSNHNFQNFAFELAAWVFKDKPNEDVVVSPLSAAIALSMLYNGAANKTKEEIMYAMGLSQYNNDSLNSLIQKWIESLKKNNINIANGIWANGSNILRPEFMDLMLKYYDAKSNSLNFSNSQSLESINNWISDKTDGNIKEAVASLNERDKIVLANAINFSQEWELEFDPDNTEKNVFYLSDGNTKPCVFIENTDKYHALEGGNFNAVAIPYKGSFTMYLLVSNGMFSNLKNLRTNIELSCFNDIVARLTKQKVIIRMPKLVTKSNIDLKKPLGHTSLDLNKCVGIKDAFDNNADFSEMSIAGKELFVSVLSQTNNIVVNESGTKATSSTVAVMTSKSISMPLSVNANRPFMFIVWDHNIDMPLLISQITGSSF